MPCWYDPNNNEFSFRWFEKVMNENRTRDCNLDINLAKRELSLLVYNKLCKNKTSSSGTHKAQLGLPAAPLILFFFVPLIRRLLSSGLLLIGLCLVLVFHILLFLCFFLLSEPDLGGIFAPKALEIAV